MIDDAEEAVFGGRSIDGQLDARAWISTRRWRKRPPVRGPCSELHDRQATRTTIAQMMGIAPGTARAQLFRARRALTRRLDL
jgi:hypothetical protein